MKSFSINIVESDRDRNTKEIVDTLMTALYEKNDTLPFLNRVFKMLPELTNEIYPGLTSDEIWNKVSQVINDRYINEEEQIQLKIQYFSGLIKSNLLPAIQELTRIYNVNYETEQRCTCFLGFFNPFPRDVILKEFCIHYDVSDEVFLRSSIHEINHMMLFDKCKEMHGYSNNVEPSYPDVLWYLEELAIEPTLNDSRIQNIIPIRHDAYESFKNIIIEGSSLTYHIQDIYNRSECIEEFLDSAYAFVEQNKSIIIID